MRGLLTATVLVMMTTATFAAGAETASPHDLQNRHRLHKPQDTAPPRQVVIPRPHGDYRPDGSLLSGARHQPRPVDVDALHRRKLKLYAGARISDALPDADGARRDVAAWTTDVGPQSERSLAAAIVFWSFVAGCVLLGLWLTARTLLDLRGH